jgi:hypothetical protein
MASERRRKSISGERGIDRVDVLEMELSFWRICLKPPRPAEIKMRPEKGPVEERRRAERMRVT